MPDIGGDLYKHVETLFPLCRSIIGEGLRETLSYIARQIPVEIHEVPSGTKVLDWVMPRDTIQHIRHGLVLTCLGDPAPPTYKRSRRGDAAIDRYVASILADEGHPDRILPFVPTGYDERQYCSPGFNLPVGRLTRSPGGTFTQYHTSADNLDFVRPEALSDSLRVLLRIVSLIEQDVVWRNTSPYGEPQLGRRGLYSSIGGEQMRQSGYDQMSLLWMLNLADGQHSLFDIAEKSGQRFEALAAAAAALANAGLLVRDL